MLKRLFPIEKEESIDKTVTILLEIGEDYCCYTFFSRDEKKLTQLQWFTFDPQNEIESLKQVLNEIKEKNNEHIIICSAHPQALLIPQNYFYTDYQLLKTIYSLPDQEYQHDRIAEWQLINMYSFSKAQYESILSFFPTAMFIHAYTPMIKLYNGFMAENQLTVHFTTNSFRVLVKKGQQLQLAQTYGYKAPLNVVYYLLKICYELGLEQPETHIILSGLIDEDSALYKELYNYFLNLHFMQASAISIDSHQYPQHFFSSFYNLALCAL